MSRCIYIFFLFLLLAVGCDKDKAVLPDQQAAFEKYLKGLHRPSLISEQEKAASLNKDPEFYTISGESVYRYIRHYYNADRLGYSEVASGDRVSITFKMYTFNNANIVETGTTITAPFYSNDPTLAEILYNSGLTPGAWSFEPLEIELGKTDIIKGLEFALPGCRERDTVELYMTYNMAYGKKPLGLLPKLTPIAVFFSVDKVTKN